MDLCFIVGFMLLFGLPQAIWPYKLARFSEQIDAIGSKTSWDEVEPAEWKVYLTRLIGIGFTGFAVIFIIMSLLG